MEWNWRTIIILLGLMLIVGIVADGIRRMRRARAEALRLDIDPDFVSSRDEFDNPELPNGGWRAVGNNSAAFDNEQADPILFDDDSFETEAERAYIDTLVNPPQETDNEDLESSLEFEEAAAVEAEIKVEQPKVQPRPVNLDEKVPVLLDVEELGAEEDQPELVVEFTAEEDHQMADELTPDPVADVEAFEATAEMIEEAAAAEEALTAAEELCEEPAEPEVIQPPINFAHPDAEKLRDRDAAEMTLVVHCITPMGKSLDGKQVANLFNSCDLRLGDDNIFHRYELADGKGNIQFSVVHSYEPQTFDAGKLLEQSFHGFSFFMRLPGPKEPLTAYDTMVGLAKFLEEQFDADLYDADRSALTQQTISHDRQQIIDFERRQQVAAKKLMRG